jgi:hypothetical protein
MTTLLNSCGFIPRRWVLTQQTSSRSFTSCLARITLAAHMRRRLGDKASAVYSRKPRRSKREPPAKGSGADRDSRDKVVVNGAACGTTRRAPPAARRAGAFESIVTGRVELTALGADQFGQSRASGIDPRVCRYRRVQASPPSRQNLT